MSKKIYFDYDLAIILQWISADIASLFVLSRDIKRTIYIIMNAALLFGGKH